MKLSIYSINRPVWNLNNLELTKEQYTVLKKNEGLYARMNFAPTNLYLTIIREICDSKSLKLFLPIEEV